jgi:oligopeptide/dipeptide ABC transporter ATP-binding protein
MSTGATGTQDVLLRIEDLRVVFDTDEGPIHAVSGVSLDIRRGETLGLVGESGCGKSVTALAVLRLIPRPPGRVVSGRIAFHGEDLLSLPIERLRAIRGNAIGMIFQEPMTALSPLHRVGDQLAEALAFHRTDSSGPARDTALAWLRKVGIPDPERCYEAYPHQLSGGMRQRAMIAMALLLGPELMIADEPTTALDVTIQAQVLGLMREVRGPETSMLLITHDMGIVWEMCDRVAVMYAGEVMETGTVDEVLKHPLNPYTEALLESVPANVPVGGRLPVIPGQVAQAKDDAVGCRFADRCRHAFDRCRREHPELVTHGAGASRCWLAAERHERRGRTGT